MFCMGARRAGCAGLIPHRGARTWETGRAASPGNGGAICAARHAAWHGQQQPKSRRYNDKARQPAASYPRIKSPLLYSRIPRYCLRIHDRTSGNMSLPWEKEYRIGTELVPGCTGISERTWSEHGSLWV